MPTQEQTQTGTHISETAKELAGEFHQVFVLGGKFTTRTGARPLIGLIHKERARMIQDAIDKELAALHTQTTAQAGVIGKLTTTGQAFLNWACPNIDVNDRNLAPEVTAFVAALLLAQKKESVSEDAKPEPIYADDFRSYDNEEGDK